MRSQRLSEIREEVLEALRRIKEELNARVYLFGSYVKGTHTVESDVDVVVISEVFKGMSYPERVGMVRLPEKVGFDIIPLTPEELDERRERAFFRDISKYWVEVE